MRANITMIFTVVIKLVESILFDKRLSSCQATPKDTSYYVSDGELY